MRGMYRQPGQGRQQSYRGTAGRYCVRR